MKEQKEIGFIGFGLIGGSIAKAIRAANLPCRLIAYKPEQCNHATFDLALQEHVLDEAVTNIAPALSNCDVIFLCAPVQANVAYMKILKDNIKPECILTDVGSVKETMHEAAIQCGLECQFIGGHPMAGSEKSGYENSNALILENAYYILTPSKSARQSDIEFMTSLVRSLNAIPMILDYQEHDRITAVISHVPHIVAALLVELVRNSADADKMRLLAAGGFKDITRIASSSPSMWKSICMTNTESISSTLHEFRDLISSVLDTLDAKDGDAIYQMFEESGNYRSLIPNTKGLLTQVFEIYLDISDEPGAIAIIATLLGSNQISIKNIGIIHNREFEQGVLRIELYDDVASNKAIKILKTHNYTIYERK